MNATTIGLNTAAGTPICFTSSLVKNQWSMNQQYLEMMNTPTVLTSRIPSLAIRTSGMQDFDGGYR
ncbi:MAG: hypothetical protein AABX14_05325 [Candidatus Aenigmatarchaeota archaeon]